MRRRESPESSLDLLLDTICNMFGMIIFIAVLAAVLASARGARQISAAQSGPIQEATDIATLEATIAALEADDDDNFRGSLESATADLLSEQAMERDCKHQLKRCRHNLTTRMSPSRSINCELMFKLSSPNSHRCTTCEISSSEHLGGGRSRDGCQFKLYSLETGFISSMTGLTGGEHRIPSGTDAPSGVPGIHRLLISIIRSLKITTHADIEQVGLRSIERYIS